MVLRKINLATVSFLIGTLIFGTIGTQAGWAQASSDRAVFQEEKQLLQMDQNQEKQLEGEKQSYQLEINKEEQQAEPYREYAEKRVAELSKLKAAGGSPTRSLATQKNGELYALEKWLAANAQARAEEQARMKQLDQAIANLQQSQNDTLKNINADINAMRGDSQATADERKFQQQMQINHFNELQSEMGAASWGRPPTDGTFNSVGGYGVGGGYGYGLNGRRRGW